MKEIKRKKHTRKLLMEFGQFSLIFEKQPVFIMREDITTFLLTVKEETLIYNP